jgi:hypothetical protein
VGEVTHKREVGTLDGTPDKRMYWSIISDYDIKTGLCELIDNAIDLWMRTKPRPPLLVELNLDAERQLIQIRDSAGGVKEEDLRLLIAPGASRNSPDAETIGIFGVGSKRAVVALAETIAIKTRHQGSKTFQIDLTKDWLESPSWDIPHYLVSDIEEGITNIDLSALRKTFDEEDITFLAQHIGETYQWFLQIENCQIMVNGNVVKPCIFEAWAYPPGNEPRQAIFTIDIRGQGKVGVEITAGLILDRDAIAENYGVCFYCNNRLVAKHLRTREVGYFVTSEAGVPHSDASLCRAIVNINGGAKLMPWNSSKSGINFSHPAFQAIRPTLIQLVSHFSSLSRRLKDDWQKQVFDFAQGSIQPIAPIELEHGKKLILPPLPKVRKPHFETLRSTNKTKIDDQPWTLGLVEAIAAVDIIARQKLETKNRIALILLDSNFEIALKEFVVHRTDLFPSNQYGDAAIKALFEKRHQVVAEVAKKVQISGTLLDKAKHYYSLRNKLVHERATVGITDADVANYRDTIEKILHILFGLRFD